MSDEAKRDMTPNEMRAEIFKVHTQLRQAQDRIAVLERALLASELELAQARRLASPPPLTGAPAPPVRPTGMEPGQRCTKISGHDDPHERNAEHHEGWMDAHAELARVPHSRCPYIQPATQEPRCEKGEGGRE